VSKINYICCGCKLEEDNKDSYPICECGDIYCLKCADDRLKFTDGLWLCYGCWNDY